ncbi:hypothetical protein RHSIM_Rhsim08G0074700 [Rhododendron simsii]|uniref:Uncharacterized protein n=1 Tax=Rhododendron simsii TaxID=118357 RepID=A0A834LH74_RHOSS|nr:hypothetical protein RHSIM_Rhsim08G0074700 [Rhododendron simsii]
MRGGTRRRQNSQRRRLRRAQNSSRTAAVTGGAASSSVVSDKLEALKNLIPAHANGERKPDQLFQETADYIVLLKTQWGDEIDSTALIVVEILLHAVMWCPY